MKTWKIATLLVVAVLATTLLVSTATAYMGGWGGHGRGNYNHGYGPYGTQTTTPPQNTAPIAPYQTVFPFQIGGGCFGRGYGGMKGGINYGYVNNYYTPNTYTNLTLNITTSTTIATNYITSIGNPDLTVEEVEEYANNFYIQVKEKSTGNGAFELIINKYTGAIYPEMGPNMMWNTKYGMMRGGILGGVFGTPTAPTTITVTQATANAQQYLNTYYPTTTTGDVTVFYGYYTIEVLNNDVPYGMISINGYTGQVWYHNWHGQFIQKIEVE
jgi:hypothetical protein